MLLPQQNGQTVRKQMDARRTRGRRGQGRDGESADGQAEMDLQMPALSRKKTAATTSGVSRDGDRRTERRRIRDGRI